MTALGPYRRDWERDALCRTTGTPDLWLSEDTTAQREAAQICQTCPVRLDCLDTALDLEGGDGPAGRATIRGGLTPTQRYRLHQATARAQATRRTA